MLLGPLARYSNTSWPLVTVTWSLVVVAKPKVPFGSGVLFAVGPEEAQVNC